MDDHNPIFRSKFLHVLLSLMLYFIATPFLTSNYISSTILCIMFSLLILASINVVADKKYFMELSIVFGILSLATYWQMMFSTSFSYGEVLHYAINVVFLCLITYSVIESVATQDKVTPDTLFGAISAYLLIGLTWSYVYLIIQCYNPAAFSDHLTAITQEDKLQHYIYYSFITLTTVGYGDMVGLTNVARMVSWIESVTGQIYLAVWISQLVGLRIVQKSK